MAADFDDLPDFSDTFALARFVERQAAALPTPEQFACQVMQEFSAVWESTTSSHIRQYLRQFAADLYQYEDYKTVPPLPPDFCEDTLQGARYRDELVAKAFQIGAPKGTINVIQAITVMILTNLTHRLAPPFNEETPKSDAFVPALYKLQNLPEFITLIIDHMSDEPIRKSSHILPRLTATLVHNNTPAAIKLRMQAPHDFSISPLELVAANFKDTPLMQLLHMPVPVRIPDEFKAVQARLLTDPDHPAHHCYQCKRRLPRDFVLQHWQELDLPKGPFFHTEQCRNTALNRHRTAGSDYFDTYKSLYKEYIVVVRDYELTKRQRDEGVRAKERLEREKMEERDYQTWQRDQERAVKEWEKEQEQLRKEEEAEIQRLADEAAAAELVAPRPVPEAARLEHTVIVAGAGWGKTQLLQSIIAQDLQKPDPPSMIVLDSTGAMIKAIQQLQLFNDRLRDRIIILDPAHSPSLNMVDFSAPRFQKYTDDQREDMEAEVIRLFEYVFASQDYDLSGQMGTAFSYAVKLIMNRPNSTIEDLQWLLEDDSKKWTDSPFKDDIADLRHGRTFFEKQFFADSLRATRASIARRIHSLLGIGAFRRMFTASINALDLFTEMNRGTIILVNTNVNLLKEDGMVLFGRYIIASALGAAFERADIPLDRRRPTYLVIDEAAPYFDDTFEKLFTRARQFKLATVMAFQHLQQASDKMKNAIASSTRVKYAGGLSYDDRARLAKDMETTPDFIASMKKDTNAPPQWSQFACYVRPDFPTACIQTIPFYQLERMPQMSEEAHQHLLARNNQRLRPHLQTHNAPVKQTSTGPLATSAKADNQPVVSPTKPQPPATRTEQLTAPDDNEPKGTWGS